MLKKLIMLLPMLLLSVFILSACNNKQELTPLGVEVVDNDEVETANESIVDVESNIYEKAIPFGAEGVHFDEMENANVNAPDIASSHVENAPPFSVEE